MGVSCAPHVPVSRVLHSSSFSARSRRSRASRPRRSPRRRPPPWPRSTAAHSRRSASRRRGIHMNGLVGDRLWVARRSRDKPLDPGQARSSRRRRCRGRRYGRRHRDQRSGRGGRTPGRSWQRPRSGSAASATPWSASRGYGATRCTATTWNSRPISSRCPRMARSKRSNSGHSNARARPRPANRRLQVQRQSGVDRPVPPSRSRHRHRGGGTAGPRFRGKLLVRSAFRRARCDRDVTLPRVVARLIAHPGRLLLLLVPAFETVPGGDTDPLGPRPPWFCGPWPC